VQSKSKKSGSEKVSLIIPIYNEEGHLLEFLEKVDVLELPVPKELVFVDDASKDKSAEILKSFKFKSDCKIFVQEQNQGKGAAVRRGISEASGTIIGVQDADFEYKMADIPVLLEPIIADEADVVYGSRFKSSHQVHRTFHYMVNRFLTMFSNVLSGMYVSDMETCYKFFKAEIIQNLVLTSNRFGFEPEVTAKIARLKLRVSEFPISYFPRNYIEGKKITWKDGVAAMRHILYFNLCAKPENSRKETMPQKYIPNSAQWL